MRVLSTLLAVRPGQTVALRDRKSGAILCRGTAQDEPIAAFAEGCAKTVRRGFEFVIEEEEQCTE